MLERNYLISLPAFGFPEVRCRLETRLGATLGLMYLALGQESGPEAAEEIVWKRLAEEVGRELIRYLMQRRHEGADPLRDGVLVTVHRDYYDDTVMQCRKFTLEAQVWKVII